jgi:DNA-binding response OmpR family regulator
MTDILIVEDEPAIMESLEFILKRCGWTVGLARDGDAALAAAHRYRPRMMLLDIMIPRRNGLDVLREMRADETLRDTSVLMLTARGQRYDRQAAEDLKADGFITKPYANTDIVAAVRRVLEPALPIEA